MKAARFLACAAMAAAGAAASAAPITINFEGVVPHDSSANNVPIGSTYSGVDFSAGSKFLCLVTETVGCSGVAKGSGGLPGSNLTAAYFDNNLDSVINVAAGFSDRFAMAYFHPFGGFGVDIGVEIWSGIDGTGSLLASVNPLAGTPDNNDGHCDVQFPSGVSGCDFVDFSLPFLGVARSVRFTQNAYAVVIDDLYFGDNQVSGIPEPGSIALSLLALVGLATARRRHPGRDPR